MLPEPRTRGGQKGSGCPRHSVFCRGFHYFCQPRAGSGKQMRREAGGGAGCALSPPPPSPPPHKLTYNERGGAIGHRMILSLRWAWPAESLPQLLLSLPVKVDWSCLRPPPVVGGASAQTMYSPLMISLLLCYKAISGSVKAFGAHNVDFYPL